VQARQTADSLLLTYATLFSEKPFQLILLSCPGQEIPLSLSSPVVNSLDRWLNDMSFVPFVTLATIVYLEFEGFRSEIAVTSDPFLGGWQCSDYSLFVIHRFIIADLSGLI